MMFSRTRPAAPGLETTNFDVPVVMTAQRRLPPCLLLIGFLSPAAPLLLPGLLLLAFLAPAAAQPVDPVSEIDVAPAAAQPADPGADLPGVNLAPAGPTYRAGRFAPDGKGFFVLLADAAKAPARIMSVSAPGARPEPVFDHPGGIGRFEVSPDGRRNAFGFHSKAGNFDIAIHEAGVVRLAAQSPDDECLPRWLPDGRLSYVRREHKFSWLPYQGVAEIVLCDAAGEIRHVFPVSGLSSGPAFSRDGSRVYFARHGHDDIEWVRAPIGLLEGRPGETELLLSSFRGFGDLAEAEPSPDERWLAFSWTPRATDRTSPRTERSEIRLLDLATHEQRTWLASDTHRLHIDRWSPDGRSLIVPYGGDGIRSAYLGLRLVPIPDALHRPPEPLPTAGPLGADTLVWFRHLDQPERGPTSHPTQRIEASHEDGRSLGIVAEHAQYFRLTGGGRMLGVSIQTPLGGAKARWRMEYRDLAAGTARVLAETEVALNVARTSEPAEESEGKPLGMPEVTPDGRRQARWFVRQGEVRLEIAQRTTNGDRDGTLRSEPVPNGWGGAEVALSPSGDWAAVILYDIAMAEQGIHQWALWLLPAAEWARPQLLEHVHDPLWDTDGGTLYAVRDLQGDEGELIAVRAAGGETRTLLAGGGLTRLGLQWDGPGRIAFVESPRGGSSAAWRGALRTVATSGGAATDLCASGVLSFAPYSRGYALLLMNGDVPTDLEGVPNEKLRGRIVVRDRATGRDAVVAADLPVANQLWLLTAASKWMTMPPTWPGGLGWTSGQ